MTIFIGIDVGGPNRGFHAVALHNGLYLDRHATTSPIELVDWCRSLNATIIAVDAPCLWAAQGKSRPAEKQIYAMGIHSYYTPTEAIAKDRDFYGWVRNGMTLYQELTRTWPLYTERTKNEPCVFETFPHAVTCALLGRITSAKTKRADRSHILAEAGIDLGPGTGMDTIDAAICALTAHRFSQGSTTAFGDTLSGWIVIPAMA
jgi:predicted RNase H-like nuclease